MMDTSEGQGKNYKILQHFTGKPKIIDSHDTEHIFSL
jgi:hypothetical protein